MIRRAAEIVVAKIAAQLMNAGSQIVFGGEGEVDNFGGCRDEGILHTRTNPYL